jgi:hypothetical protein
MTPGILLNSLMMASLRALGGVLPSRICPLRKADFVSRQLQIENEFTY